ncbi:hypothetical protein LPB72_18180 [Hydrogenophaga crassostreae]|uniref:Uncharacterized protein n=1 Tax=Hydrogenophaga crassostreae TaxID=1763535 RepID=A0A163C8E3_9BURK|nr:hypothetical protein [Hydrogenophaga crassostreae]AOW12907.1 hypothetical protein LPB072_08685 [Hydrogenophaga crassostreae]OAD40091.1 hypothetical protein LPB72_18180 [Hydrogenophaga crassostreae]
MNHTTFARSLVRLAVFSSLALTVGFTQAQTGERAVDDAFALNACLAAWGSHPFGSHLRYTTLSTSVKFSGAGPATSDRSVTNHPSLILVDPLVNATGDASIALMNPNGWYCLRAPDHLLGALRIQLHCRARLAAGSGGTTTWGTDSDRSAKVVMGSVQVERTGCN